MLKVNTGQFTIRLTGIYIFVILSIYSIKNYYLIYGVHSISSTLNHSQPPIHICGGIGHAPIFDPS